MKSKAHEKVRHLAYGKGGDVEELGHEAIRGVVTVGTVGITAGLMGGMIGGLPPIK